MGSAGRLRSDALVDESYVGDCDKLCKNNRQRIISDAEPSPKVNDMRNGMLCILLNLLFDLTYGRIVLSDIQTKAGPD
ncbi:MAG: hypothetical protein ACRD8U_08760, partial [Pyrinomonadaceae bacterium]